MQHLNKHLKSPLTKFVMHFLEYSLDFLCKFNAVFQSDLSMLPSLKAEVLRLLRILLGKCIISEVNTMTHEDLITVNLSESTLRLQDNELGIICQKKRITLIQVHLWWCESSTRLWPQLFSRSLHSMTMSLMT